MAHSFSAKKRARQNIVRRARNRARISAVRTQVKKVQSLSRTAGDVESLEKEVKVAQKKIDKLIAKGNIHKNTGARKKSQLMKLVNQAKAKTH